MVEMAPVEKTNLSSVSCSKLVNWLNLVTKRGTCDILPPQDIYKLWLFPWAQIKRIKMWNCATSLKERHQVVNFLSTVIHWLILRSHRIAIASWGSGGVETVLGKSQICPSPGNFKDLDYKSGILWIRFFFPLKYWRFSVWGSASVTIVASTFKNYYGSVLVKWIVNSRFYMSSSLDTIVPIWQKDEVKN